MKVMSQSIENRICRKIIVLFQVCCICLIKQDEIESNLNALLKEV